jgi:hypothetical protein
VKVNVSTKLPRSDGSWRLIPTRLAGADAGGVGELDQRAAAEGGARGSTPVLAARVSVRAPGAGLKETNRSLPRPGVHAPAPEEFPRSNKGILNCRLLWAPVRILGRVATMPAFDFLWTDEIVEHLAEHGISQDDFEKVVCNPTRKGYSRSSGLPCVWGYTEDGHYIIAVYEEIDAITILPSRPTKLLSPTERFP